VDVSSAASVEIVGYIIRDVVKLRTLQKYKHQLHNEISMH
jgi:hypothetical protein